MLSLKIKKDQISTVKLKNGIKLTLNGSKEYEQSFLQLLFDEGFTNLVKKTVEKKPKEK
jgi:hypothetical protein